MIVEGVPYYRYVITYTTVRGKRRRLVRWSPGRPWIGNEVDREMYHLRGSGLEPKPGSNLYIKASS